MGHIFRISLVGNCHTLKTITNKLQLDLDQLTILHVSLRTTFTRLSHENPNEISHTPKRYDAITSSGRN